MVILVPRQTDLIQNRCILPVQNSNWLNSSRASSSFVRSVAITPERRIHTAAEMDFEALQVNSRKFCSSGICFRHLLIS